MRRSEVPLPASDEMMREIVRQLADAAPPVPNWDDLRTSATTKAAPSTGAGWGRMALVAAVTALVVSGVWWLRGPSNEPAQPADTPVPVPSAESIAPVSPLEPPEAWRAWATGTNPLDVQVCMTRVASNLVAESDLPEPAAGADLAGASAEAFELIWHRSTNSMMAGLVTHPDLEPSVAADLTMVVDAYIAAQALQFDESGATSPDLAPAVESFLAARDASDALQPDPERCWLETDAGADLVSTSSVGLGVPELIECLAFARLDHALATPDIEFDVIIDAAVVAVLNHPRDSVLSSSTLDITREIRDSILFDPTDEEGSRQQAHEALVQLAEPDFLPACQLFPTTQIDRPSNGEIQP